MINKKCNNDCNAINLIDEIQIKINEDIKIGGNFNMNIHMLNAVSGVIMSPMVDRLRKKYLSMI